MRLSIKRAILITGYENAYVPKTVKSRKRSERGRAWQWRCAIVVSFWGVVVVLLSTIAVSYFAVLNSCLDNAKNR